MGKSEVQSPRMKQEIDEIQKTFPWYPRFLRLAIESIGSSDEELVKSLILTFLRFVSADVEKCYGRPRRAAKLKSVVTRMLVYFSLFCRDAKSKAEVVHLEFMTDLVALYMDLEIKACKRGIESLKKVGSVLASALYLFLGHSEAHMAEAILKAKLMTKSNEGVCALVLSKFLKDAECLVTRDGDYMRFLLAFKLWKTILRDPIEKKTIDKVAACKLSAPPEVVNHVNKMRGMLRTDTDITLFLMGTKTDLFRFKREFLKSNSLSNFDESLAQGYLATDFLSNSLPLSEFQFAPGGSVCLQEKFSSPQKNAETHLGEETSDVMREWNFENEETLAVAAVEAEKSEPKANEESRDASENARTDRGSCSERVSVEARPPRPRGLQDYGEPTEMQNSGTGRPETVRYESLAKRFRIVKSNELKKECGNSFEKSVKGFVFSSRLVKVTKEELTGNKPARTRNWKGRRSAQRKATEATGNPEPRRRAGRGAAGGNPSKAFDPHGGSFISAGAPGWFPEWQNTLEKDSGDLLRFVNPEDDFVCFRELQNSLAEHPLELKPFPGFPDCSNCFDSPADGLFFGYGGDEGIAQSVPGGAGTVCSFVRKSISRRFCMSCADRRLPACRILGQRAETLRRLEADRSKHEEELQRLQSLPPKKRLRLLQGQLSRL